MSYASQSGRAKTSARNPQAHAICDRCSFRYNLVDLQWQYDFRGPIQQNLRILVCKKCLDVPQEQLRAIVLPADPVPKENARPQDFIGASSDFRTLGPPTIDPTTGIPVPSQVLRVTQSNQNRTTSPYGRPTGLSQNAVMPRQAGANYGVSIPVLSISSVGCLVTVTCSAVHGLQPDGQVSIEGLTAGNGFYSVQVPTATMFTFQTKDPVNPQLTPGTRVVNTLVGLPRNYVDFPLPYGSSEGQPTLTPPGPPTNVMVVPE